MTDEVKPVANSNPGVDATEQEERKKDDAFLNEVVEVAKKHNRDIGAKLNFSAQGIIPTPVVVRKKPESPILKP